MKTLKLIVTSLLFSTSVSAFACADVTRQVKSVLSGTPGCLDKNYRRKTEDQLAQLKPFQLIDEHVETGFRGNEFEGGYHAWAAYQSLVDRYIRRSGAEMLPSLLSPINALDPKYNSKCDHARFWAAAKAAHDLDRFEFRLRGSTEGELVIASLERALAKLRDAGFAIRENNYEYNRQFRLLELYLKTLNGINDVDVSIKDTFREDRKIELTDRELLEFSRFLVSFDPTYPSWSDGEFMPVGEGERSRMIYKLKNPARFYKAYSEFKQQQSRLPKDRLKQK